MRSAAGSQFSASSSRSTCRRSARRASGPPSRAGKAATLAREEIRLQVRADVRRAFYEVLRRQAELDLATDTRAPDRRHPPPRGGARRGGRIAAPRAVAGRGGSGGCDERRRVGAAARRPGESDAARRRGARGRRTRCTSKASSPRRPRSRRSTRCATRCSPAIRALAQARAEVRRAEARLATERALRVPQPTLRRGRATRSPRRETRCSASRVPIPLFDRRQGPIGEAAAAVGVAAAEAEPAPARAGRRARERLQRATRSPREQIAAFEGGLLKQADAALRVAESAYRFGERGFIEVLDAQRVLRAGRAPTSSPRASTSSRRYVDLEQLRASEPEGRPQVKRAVAIAALAALVTGCGEQKPSHHPHHAPGPRSARRAGAARRLLERLTLGRRRRGRGAVDASGSPAASRPTRPASRASARRSPGASCELEVLEGRRREARPGARDAHQHRALGRAARLPQGATRSRLLAERAAAPRAGSCCEADVIGQAELQRREGGARPGRRRALRRARSAEGARACPARAIERLGSTRTGRLRRPGGLVSIDGTVIDRKVTAGQVVQPADTVFVVADLSNVWLVADVPEQSAGTPAPSASACEAEIAALPGRRDRGRALVRQRDGESRRRGPCGCAWTCRTRRASSSRRCSPRCCSRARPQQQRGRAERGGRARGEPGSRLRADRARHVRAAARSRSAAEHGGRRVVLERPARRREDRRRRRVSPEQRAQAPSRCRAS